MTSNNLYKNRAEGEVFITARLLEVIIPKASLILDLYPPPPNNNLFFLFFKTARERNRQHHCTVTFFVTTLSVTGC